MVISRVIFIVCREHVKTRTNTAKKYNAILGIQCIENFVWCAPRTTSILSLAISHFRSWRFDTAYTHTDRQWAQMCLRVKLHRAEIMRLSTRDREYIQFLVETTQKWMKYRKKKENAACLFKMSSNKIITKNSSDSFFFCSHWLTGALLRVA